MLVNSSLNKFEADVWFSMFYSSHKQCFWRIFCFSDIPVCKYIYPLIGRVMLLQTNGKKRYYYRIVRTQLLMNKTPPDHPQRIHCVNIISQSRYLKLAPPKPEITIGTSTEGLISLLSSNQRALDAGYTPIFTKIHSYSNSTGSRPGYSRFAARDRNSSRWWPQKHGRTFRRLSTCRAHAWRYVRPVTHIRAAIFIWRRCMCGRERSTRFLRHHAPLLYHRLK